MIADPELQPFVRFYRFAKKEDDAFRSRYTLAAGTVLTTHGQRFREGKAISIQDKGLKADQKEITQKKQEKNKSIQRPSKNEINKQQEQQNDEEYQSCQSESQSSSQREQKLEKKIKTNQKEERRKVEMTMKQFQEIKQFTKINRKHIKILETTEKQGSLAANQSKKKKKYKKMEETKESKSASQGLKEGKRDKKSRKEQKKNQNKLPQFQYQEYLDLKQIQRSLQQDQQRFFKGRVQFGQGPKYRGKIVSEEVEGVLLIEGKHRNRSLHDDKVYFEILHKENDKIYCNIVHIIPTKREIVGRIDYISSKAQYIMNPINSRIAVLNVKPESVDKEMIKKLESHYFRAEYIGWQQKSDFPECRVIEEFGKFGDIEIETTALLRTHNVQDVQHDHEAVKNDLAKFLSRMNEKGEYQIPQEEIAKRQDLRKKRIFTIDPLNARDFDDALSITIEGDIYQVGVHIADASFFCEEGSLVDREARKRTTSVYLVHRVIPMLPRILCQNFCSLNPGCERLTFSLWVKVNKDGQILSTPRITRSVIKSCARFTYEQAQGIIQGTINSQKDLQEGFGCVNANEYDEVAKDIKLMHSLAVEFRKRRVQRGSLFFEVPRKVFKLNEDKMPKEFQIYQRKQANFLVQQFMIMANELVGDVLVKETRENALLRRHRYPGPKKIARFQQFLKNIGIPLKLSRETRVQDLINEVVSKQGLKQSVKDLVKFQMIGLLEAADYFLVGKSPSNTWVHYALNAPTYTHFTSPIRRYPDILVHRQLAAILDKKHEKTKISKQLIDLCNEKKLMAKRVSNGCEKIFMCLYLKENTVLARGIVTETEDWGIKICIPSHDFKGVLRFKEINGLKVTAVDQDEEGRKALQMEYKGKVSLKFSLKLYQQLEFSLGCKDSFPIDYKLSIIIGHPRKAGQHVIVG